MKDLAGKTAFVTGAASGIGSGIATVLSQAGVKVMLCDIEEAALTKAVADLKLTNADVDGVKNLKTGIGTVLRIKSDWQREFDPRNSALAQGLFR
jgi:NADP-dependent 3-hydroxy acid dehydrogenase YdfG